MDNKSEIANRKEVRRARFLREAAVPVCKTAWLQEAPGVPIALDRPWHTLHECLSTLFMQPEGRGDKESFPVPAISGQG